MVFLFHDGKDDEQLTQRLSLLLNQGADGAVIAGTAGSSDDLQRIAGEKAIPVIFVSHVSHLDDADTVRLDNMQAAQLLTEHPIRNGHQRITRLEGQSSLLTRTERVGDYYATLLKFGLPFHSDWVLECTLSQKQTAEAVTTLLRRNPTISTVVCYNETIAVGVWFSLLKAGRQSGESGADCYFGQQVSLVVSTDVTPTTFDDISIT